MLDQLQDLQLYNPDDLGKNMVHQFMYEETKIDYKKILTCKGSTKSLIKESLCAISIKFPSQLLDKVAEEL